MLGCAEIGNDGNCTMKKGKGTKQAFDTIDVAAEQRARLAALVGCCDAPT